MLASTCLSGQAIAEMDSQAYAFPDRWMILLGAYVVDGADTQISVNSDVGLGTSIDYERDLFALGIGLARIGLDVDVNDDNWCGSVTDSYRGYNVFGTLYF
jgi:hypothetical protein